MRSDVYKQEQFILIVLKTLKISFCGQGAYFHTWALRPVCMICARMEVDGSYKGVGWQFMYLGYCRCSPHTFPEATRHPKEMDWGGGILAFDVVYLFSWTRASSTLSPIPVSTAIQSEESSMFAHIY